MERDVESRVKISWNQFHEIFREIDFKNFFNKYHVIKVKSNFSILSGVERIIQQIYLYIFREVERVTGSSHVSQKGRFHFFSSHR